MQANPNTVPAEQPASPMLSELGIDLIEHFRAQGRAVTWVNRWKTHLEPYFGAMAADSVNDEVVAAYVDLRRKQWATDITIETELGVLIRVYTLAVENGKLSKRPRIKRPNARWSRQAEKRKAEREKAAQLALQTVHDCDTCRKVLHKLFLAKPSAIERYHRDVKAARADPTIAIQEKKPCECCHLAPIAGKHGNAKYCIPCQIVREGESKREGTRRHRARQRGDAPVEEERRCKGCGEILEPDPDTGRIDPRRQYCDRCAEERNLDAKIGWKKKKRAEERAEAGHDCRGLKIDKDEWIRQCGVWMVPAKSMKQEFCTRECGGRTQSILYRLDPKTATHYRDHARKKAAERARLKNVEGLELKTGLQCSLAAHWTLPCEGKSQYVQAQVIAPLLYSDSTDPVDAAKKFLGRWDEPVIKDERQRLAKLDADQRQMELKQLEVRLKAEQAKPLKKAS